MKLPYDDQIPLFNINDRIRTCSSFAICVVSYTLNQEILLYHKCVRSIYNSRIEILYSYIKKEIMLSVSMEFL